LAGSRGWLLGLSVTLVLLLTVACAAQPVAAYTSQKSIILPLLAVGENEKGVVIETLVKLLYPGKGLVAVSPSMTVARDTADSARVGFYYAAIESMHDPLSFDASIHFETSRELSGPSASGFIATALLLLFRGLSLAHNVSMTGMVNPNGLLLPIAGLKAKLEAAKEHGYTLVVVPLTLNPRMNPSVPGVEKVQVCMVDEAASVMASTTKSLFYPPPSLNLSWVRGVEEGFAPAAKHLQELARRVADLLPKEMRRAPLRLVQDSEKLLKEGYPYAAASLAFAALYNASMTFINTGGVPGRLWAILGTPQQARAEAAKAVEEARDRFASARMIGVWGFEALAMAEARLYVSEALAFKTSTVDQVYSVLRALTAEAWARMASPDLGPKIPREAVVKAVHAALVYADAAKKYTMDLFGQSFKIYGFIPADTWMKEAERAYTQGLYARAYGLAATLVAESSMWLAGGFMREDINAFYTCSRQAAYLHNYWLSMVAGDPSFVSTVLIRYLNKAGKTLGTGTAIALYNEAAAYALLDKLFYIYSTAVTKPATSMRIVETDSLLLAAVAAALVTAVTMYAGYWAVAGRREVFVVEGGESD